MIARDRNWLLVFFVCVALVAIYPFFADGYRLTVIRDALIFGLFAASLDFFWGRTGILCFGHAAFFGIGGYVMARVMLDVAIPFAGLLGLVGAVVGAAFVAGIIGYFLFFGGIRGSYFTIVTLAMCVICQQAAISWSSVTGGDSGLIGIPPLEFDSGRLHLDLGQDLPSYIFVAGVVTLIVFVLWSISRGRWGTVLVAIQDNEVRAAALGHNAPLRLLATFVLSAAIAGLAGALYVCMAGLVAPDLAGLLLSTEVIVWVAVGGRGTLLGPVLGAFFILRAQQVISSLNPSLWPLVLGCVFVVIVFLLPDGILSIFARLKALLRAGSKAP
jgi:branched-chain amino acid transport system permease protein